MFGLKEIVEFVSGSPQFRISETAEPDAPLYFYYGQAELERDWKGIDSNRIDSKQVRTFDPVSLLVEGDLVFSLITGQATVVSRRHEGYLYTQNYVKLICASQVDAKFLAYMLNENPVIQKRLQRGLQGSQVFKYSLKQLKELEIFHLPIIEKQQVIGQLYFDQLYSESLKNRISRSETMLVLQRLGEASRQ